MSINKAWHEKHKMPKNPAEAEKRKWHLAHAKHCGCRPLPEKYKTEIRLT